VFGAVDGGTEGRSWKSVMTNSETRLALVKLWGHFMREKLFSNALVVSSLLHSEGLRLNNTGMIEEASKTLQTALEEFSSKEAAQPKIEACSFCGLAPPRVQLGAGPGAFICNVCVATFSKLFRNVET
jgi:hypothetical protein